MGRKYFLKKRNLMIIRIISIGNKLNLSESKSIEYFIKQIPKNFQVEFINLKGQQNPKYTHQEVIKKESKLILSRILKKDFVIACDSTGDQINSSQFSKLILRCQKNYKTICFIIGGSFGLSPEIKDNSNKVLSASLFTFPHRLFRLILVEQIYRAHTIVNNMPYHK